MIGIHVGGMIVYAKPRLREFLGIQDDVEPGDWSMHAFIHPDDLALVTKRMAHVYLTGEAASPMKERLLDINGNVKEVMVFSLPTIYRGKLGCEFNIQPFS
jgi:PAS domain-containing protein